MFDKELLHNWKTTLESRVEDIMQHVLSLTQQAEKLEEQRLDLQSKVCTDS